LLSAMESEHRSVICPLGEAGKVLDVALSCRVQAVCVVLLLLILGLLCSCLWRQTSQTCQKAQARAGQREPLEFDAVPSGLSGKSEASTAGPEGEAGPASASELPKMASRYSIKSAFSRWTRAKAKVRVVWKLNLQQVQNWLNGKGEAPQLDQKLQVRPADLEAGDDGEQDEGDDGAQVPQERGSLDDPMPPRASAAVGFLQGTALPLPAMPAYADGDRVEYFSPTCGLWLLGEVTVKSDAKRTVSYAVTLKGRWRAQERPHVPLELLRAPLQVGEPVELWSRSSFKWLLAEVDGLEATTALLRHYKVRVFGQEAVAVAEASYLRRRFLKGSAVEVYRGPSRGWICTRVSDRAPLGGCDFASPADGDPVDEAEGEVTWPSAEPPLELWEPQSDGRRGAPPRKSDGSRFQPCDFVAMIPVLKEFAVSTEEVEEVPSFLLRPAASSPSCPSQVFQI